VVGVVEGRKEDGESWRGLLRNLQERGLRQVRLVISDKSKGLISVLPEFYPDAKWQRCVFHFHQNVLHEVPTTRSREVAAMLKAIHAQESAQACRAKAMEIVERPPEELDRNDELFISRKTHQIHHTDQRAWSS
jgi:transposase-like protein